MIIDITISALENQMSYEHILCKKTARVQRRELAIGDFLVKQGKKFSQTLNYIAFWQDGKITGVHVLSEYNI